MKRDQTKPKESALSPFGPPERLIGLAETHVTTGSFSARYRFSNVASEIAFETDRAFWSSQRADIAAQDYSCV